MRVSRKMLVLSLGHHPFLPLLSFWTSSSWTPSEHCGYGMIDRAVSAVSFHLPNGLLAAAVSHKTSCGHSTGQCAVQGVVTSSRNVVCTAEELGFLLNVFF